VGWTKITTEDLYGGADLVLNGLDADIHFLCNLLMAHLIIMPEAKGC
jgi:hypothetical protein